MKKRLFIPVLALIALTGVAQPGYWQQAVKYKMDVDFDVESHRFTGTQKLTYTNNSPDTLNKVFYHLYFNAFQPNSMMDTRSRSIEDPDGRVMDRINGLSEDEIGYQKIDELTQDGKKVDYVIENTVLEVTLADPIFPGSSVVFDMKWNGQVPSQIRRSGRYNKEGVAYSMSQWFPKIAEYDRRGWHAHPYVGREFYSPWGTYDVSITIDKDFVVAGSGVLQNPNTIGRGYEDEGVKVKKIKGKTITWNFIAENVHDFMWAADPDYIHTKAQVPNGPTLHFFYQPDSATKNWEELPGYTVRAFEYINENFGKYPYSEFYVVQGGDGGMEYPMSTLITGHRKLGSLVGVTVHEAMHSWYQGVLATNESYLEWMDEGYTSYATSRTMNHLFNQNNPRPAAGSYRGYFSLATSGKEEPLSTHADQYETNFAYGRAAYSKGAVSIAQLGYIIGEENRDATLLRYFDEWQFKHPDMNDFIRVAEKVSGLELDWYYDYWVNSTKTIDYGVVSAESSDAGTEVNLERKGLMPMPIDLVVTKKDGSQQLYYIPLGIMRGEKPNESGMDRTIASDWYWTHPSYQLQIDIPLSEIESIEIDPSERMADINRENNKFEN